MNSPAIEALTVLLPSRLVVETDFFTSPPSFEEEEVAASSNSPFVRSDAAEGADGVRVTGVRSYAIMCKISARIAI